MRYLNLCALALLVAASGAQTTRHIVVNASQQVGVLKNLQGELNSSYPSNTSSNHHAGTNTADTCKLSINTDGVSYSNGPCQPMLRQVNGPKTPFTTRTRRSERYSRSTELSTYWFVWEKTHRDIRYQVPQLTRVPICSSRYIPRGLHGLRQGWCGWGSLY